MKAIVQSILFVFLILFFSCTEETDFEHPLVFTGGVTNVNGKGATFNAKIANYSDTEIIEYGFVWDTNANPKIDNAQKYLVNEVSEKGTFNAKISTALEKDVGYVVRAFIRNGSTVLYGNDVVFNSKGSIAPTIKEIFPKTANLNDTLLIIGNNFSYKKNDNKISFGNFTAKVNKATQDTLWTIVPAKLNQPFSVLKVSILDHVTISTDKFELITPIITDSIINGTFGSQIIINGDNFMSNPNTLKVFFNETKLEILEVQNQSIKIGLPISLNQRNNIIRVQMNNLSVSTNFVLNDLEIDDFNPKKITTDQTLTLYGYNFSPDLWKNSVKVGGIRAQIINAEVNKLEVKLTSQKYNRYPSREVNVEVSVLGQTKTFNSTLLINDRWFRLPNAPFHLNQSSSKFVTSNNKVFLINISGYLSYHPTELWCYSIETQEWQQLPNFPGYTRERTTAFIINDKIYFGTGFIRDKPLKGPQNDFWEYDILSEKWNKKNDFPGQKRYDVASFAIKDKGYLVGGANYDLNTTPFDDCWEYNPDTDSWVEMQNIFYPESSGIQGIQGADAVANDNSAILGLGYFGTESKDTDYERMFMFNPSAANLWSEIESFPEDYRYFKPISFLFEGNPTFFSKESFFSYDLLSKSWLPKFTSIFDDIDFTWVIAAEDKIYFGVSVNQIWEYDPNRE